jgi:hypothetical protein
MPPRTEETVVRNETDRSSWAEWPSEISSELSVERHGCNLEM